MRHETKITLIKNAVCFRFIKHVCVCNFHWIVLSRLWRNYSFLFEVEKRCWESIKRSRVTFGGREQWGWGQERNKVFFSKPLKGGKWMEWALGVLGTAQVEAVWGNPPSTSYLAFNATSPTTSAPGETLSSFHSESRSGDKGGGAQCVCTRRIQTGYSPLQP